MTPERRAREIPPVAFDVWKLQLHKDCELRDKLPAFNAIGNEVLRLLWETGLEPTVRAIVEDIPKQSGQSN